MQKWFSVVSPFSVDELELKVQHYLIVLDRNPSCLFIFQVLKRPEYFGKFGKIHKVVINNSTSYAGSQVRAATEPQIWFGPEAEISGYRWPVCSFTPQGPSASAYVTYIRSEDALRAIQCVNNVVVDGRTLKVSPDMMFLYIINCLFSFTQI